MADYGRSKLSRTIAVVAASLMVFGTISSLTSFFGPQKAGAAAAILTQRSYRFQNDDGTNVNNNTNQENPDTPRTGVLIGERLNVRLQVDNTGDGTANKRLKIQYDKSDNNWVDVASTAEIKPSYGMSGTNGDLLTSSVCSANALTWSDGTWQEGTGQTGVFVFKKQFYTEFGFMVETSAALAGTTYRLRLYNDTNGQPLDTYTVYPTITMVDAAGNNATYSKEESASLAANDANLMYFFDTQSYADVAADDSVRNPITSAAGYPVFLFKQKNTDNTDNIEITWDGQSSVATSTNTVYMQIYNYNTSSWEQIGFNNTTGANTDFSMTYSIVSSVGNYYNASNWVAVRVYQAQGAETLRMDLIGITFTSPFLNQSSYRFQNDDGTNVNNNTNQAGPDSPRSNVKKGERINLRVQVENTGTGDTQSNTYKLQYDKNDSNWVDVAPAAEIKPSPGLSGANGDALTSAVGSANPRTWANGTWHEGTASTNSYSLNNGYYTEFSFMVDTSQASVNTTYRFRLYNSTGSKVLDGYGIYPTITTVSAVGDVARYSKEAVSSLSANDPDLAYYLDDKGYSDVSLDDSVRDPITASSAYPVFLFKRKNTNSSDNIQIKWDGQSSVATSTNAVFLELYNYSTSTWEQVNSNNAAPADSDFTMTHLQNINLAQYYDATNHIAVRAYQASGDETLRTDWLEIKFSVPIVTQRSYRFQNDDGTTVDNNTNQESPDTPRSGVKLSERVNLRIQLDNTGTGADASKVYKLQYDKNDSNWVDVGPATEIRPSPGLSGVNGDTIGTPVCSANARSWADGSYHENTNATNSYTLNGGFYTEFSFLFTARYASLNTTYRFRLYDQTDGKPLDFYTVYPALTTTASTTVLDCTKGTPAALPLNTDSLTYDLDDKGYDDIFADDSVRDRITSAAGYPVYLYKESNLNNLNNIQITWDGQSDVATTVTTVYMEIYNFSTSSWEQVASNNTTPADTDFTMIYEQSVNVTDYYDGSNTAAARVYQGSGAETLRTDLFDILFTGSVVTQTSYRLQNDDGADVNSNTNQALPDTSRTGVKIGERINIRIQIDNTGTGTETNKVYKLQYDKNDDVWTDVAPAAEIRPSFGISGSTGDLVDSSVCSPNIRTWSDGAWFENTNSSNNRTLGSGYYTELSYMVSTGYAATSQAYRFRLYNETDAAPLDSYTIYPTFTMVDPANNTVKYSKGTSAAPPPNPDDMTYYLDNSGYLILSGDDSQRDSVTASSVPIYLYKTNNDNNTDNIEITWDGQSTVSTTVGTMYMELYNTSTSTWEQVAFNNTTPANIDFTMAYVKSVNVSDYYDVTNTVAVRVYQDSETATLSTDLFDIDFTAPVMNQRSYRFQNDDGADVDGDTNQAPADTPRNDVKKGERITLRLQVDNTGSGIGSEKTYVLQYDKNDNNWTGVAPAAEIRPSFGIAGSTGDPITGSVCTANPRTWSDGVWHENTGTSAVYTLEDSSYTEFGFIIQTGSASLNTTYRFRLYNQTDDKPLDSYVVYPTLGVVNADNDVYRHSKDSLAALPANDADVTYFLDDSGYGDIANDDSARDPLASSATYPVFLFKQKNANDSDNISITWDGQSTEAASANPVYLQLYNYTSASWVTVNSNNSAQMNTDFTITHIQATSQSDYYDAANWVAVRLYQNTGSQVLKTNQLRINFVGPYSSITAPVNRAYIRGASYTIRGHAGSAPSGAPVVLVEVSTDGGNTWNPAVGTSSWTFDWPLPGDGIYNIRSRATDGDAIVEVPGLGVRVTVDNTPPVAAITSPINNEIISGAVPFIGTATDLNFAKYELEFGRGDPPAGYARYGTFHGSQVTADVLETVDAFKLYDEGYTFRLVVKDMAGNESTAQVAVTIDSPERPPGPHGRYQLDTDVCALCHGTHTAVFAPGVLKMTTDYQSTLCYACHSEGGSIYDVQTEFDGSPSHHPIKDAFYATEPGHTEDCSTCHDPHGSEELGGDPYPRLLRVVDADGDKFYQGNPVCYACHGEGGSVKDMRYFEDNNAHNNTDPGQTSTFPNPVSGTSIKCSKCHEPHGSQLAPLRISAESTLCVSCHSDTAYALRADNEVVVGLGYPGGELEPYYAAARVFSQDSFSAPPVTLKGPKEYRVPDDDFSPLTRGIAIGDATNDGLPDVVEVIWQSAASNAIVIYAQKDDGYGLEPARVYTGYGGYGVAIGDVNSDNLNEVVTTTMSAPNEMRITTFMGAGILSSSTQSTGGTDPREVAIGDIDSDGKNDAVVANYGSNNISVFKQVAGTLQLSQVIASGGDYPYGAAIGDVDNNGDNEAVIANHGYSTPVPPPPTSADNVAVFSQSGGNLVQTGSLDNGAATVGWDVAIGDVQDGTAGNEIICAGKPGDAAALGVMTVFSITGGTGTGYSTGSYDTKGVATGDVNSDGSVDAVLLNSDSISVFTHGGAAPGGPTLYYMSGVNATGQTDEPGPIAIGNVGQEHPFGHRKEEIDNCSPCHDPHGTTKAEPVLGADGVQPTYDGFSITYNQVDRSTSIYQVCMTCHSSYKVPMDGTHNTAAEFNPVNQSYHPILAVGRRQDIPAGAFVAPWSVSSTMDCDNCHEPSVGADPRLHSDSAYAYGLVKPYIGANVGEAGLLCYSCHEPTYYYVSDPTGLDLPSYVWRRPQSSTAHKIHTGRRIHCTTCHEPHGNASNPGKIRPEMEMQPQPITGEFLCAGGCHP